MRIPAALVVAVIMLVSALAPAVDAQTRRRTTPARPAPAPPRVEAAMVQCPAVLGDGATSKRTFCDVLIGGNPAEGIIVTIPPHTGDVKLMFDLHNRHTFSAELAKSRAGFRRYSAGIGVMAMDVTLLSRAGVESEFRAATDLFDRVVGTGPGGLKAVAPIGVEKIVITLTDDDLGDDLRVSILGERLAEVRPDGTTDVFTAAGRPIAVVSEIRLEYRPAPVKPAAKPPARTTTPTRRK
jgi:hypothetical protein